MPSRGFTLGEGPLRIVPVCHYRMEFAFCVRAAILEVRPAAVAIELPPALAEPFLAAVRRFPYLSVVSYEDSGGETLFLPVEPADPLAEAARTALELGIPVHLVDLHVKGYPLWREPVPDSYAVAGLGLQRYWEAYDRVPRARSEHDVRRELHMAAAAGRLAEEGEVLLVCGMAHARPVLEAWQQRRGRTGRHAAIRSAAVADPDLESIREIGGEMPFVSAVYELLRGGPGPEETWMDPPADPEPETRPGGGLDEMTGRDAVGALEALLGIGGGEGGPPEALPPEARRAVAAYLRRLQERRLYLPGQEPPPPPELAGVPPPPDTRIFKFRSVPERRSELLGVYRGAADEAAPALDRQKLLARLFEAAGRFYEENTGEEIKGWQRRTLSEFAARYARVTGALLPDLYQCVVSARGVLDDNYAYEVWDLASLYPWVDGSGDLPVIRVRAGEVWLGERKMTFRRRWPRLRERLTRVPIHRRQEEESPGDWVREFQRGTICSYPPEDVVIEDFGRYLRKKALRTLSEERTRVEEFTSSMLDGIDMRETLRNWGSPPHGRIFVREVQRVHGGAGAVVLIFDEDPQDRFPWTMSWHGEHDQESDMAFYSTAARSRVVGPGIARCEYGGLMLTYPPGRLMDVWSDPLYRSARTKPEVLLMAALDYSLEKHVVYVAAKPPRSFFRTLAGRLGKKLVYLPIGQLSPVSLKRIRVFHVLSSHQARRIAKDYVW